MEKIQEDECNEDHIEQNGNVSNEGNYVSCELDLFSCDEQIPADEIKTFVGLFLLKLQTILHVPVTTIQKILYDFNELHDLSKSQLLASVATAVHEEYPFHKLTKEQTGVIDLKDTSYNLCNKGELSTSKLRIFFVKDNLHYIEPVEIDLGYKEGKNRTFVYIPLLKCSEATVK